MAQRQAAPSATDNRSRSSRPSSTPTSPCLRRSALRPLPGGGGEAVSRAWSSSSPMPSTRTLAGTVAGTASCRCCTTCRRATWERWSACRLPSDRVGEFQDGVGRAIEYATALASQAAELPRRRSPRPAAMRSRCIATFVANPRLRRRQAGGSGHSPAGRADQHLLTSRLPLNRTVQAIAPIERYRLAQPVAAVRPVSHAAHGGRARQHHREAPARRHMQIAVPANEPGKLKTGLPGCSASSTSSAAEGWTGCEQSPPHPRRAGAEFQALAG